MSKNRFGNKFDFSRRLIDGKILIMEEKTQQEEELKDKVEDSNQEVNDTQAEEENTSSDQQSEEQEELSDLEKKEIELKELNDKYLRLYSEFDNFRRRTQKEKLDLYKTAGEDIFKSLLPVMDDFERAQKSMEDSKDFDSLKTGVDLIYNKFLGIFKSNGVAPMDATGKEFDSEIHEAVTQIPAPNKKMKGKVIDVVEKGYVLNEKVIRYAKVVVGK